MSAKPRKKRRRLSNGAEIYVLPDARKEMSERVFAVLRGCLDTITDLYGDDLGGFVLVPWGAAGNGEPTVFTCTQALHPKAHDLPHYIAEALRRDLAERRLLELVETD